MIISSIDIGTNTVLLLIAETDPKNNKIIPILNKYSIPRIGKNVENTGVISKESAQKLREVLLEYKTISDAYRSNRIIAGATAGFRKAGNSNELIDWLYSETGVKIKIISGDEEALFAYMGVTDGIIDGRKKLIIDIGGGSTELITGVDDNITYNNSFNIGVVSIVENINEKKEAELYIQNTFKDLINSNLKPDITYAIAGTPTTLASIKLNLQEFKEDDVEGTIINGSEIESFIDNYSQQPEYYQYRYSKILSGREDLMIPGSLILLTIMNNLNIPEIVVSTKGIRHGIIIDFLKNQG